MPHLIAPSSTPEVEPTSIQSSSQKGMHAHHPKLSRSRRDTPSFGSVNRPSPGADVNVANAPITGIAHYLHNLDRSRPTPNLRRPNCCAARQRRTMCDRVSSSAQGRPMRRREFISVLGSTAAAWPFATYAQQGAALPLVGILGSGPPRGYWAELFAAFRQGLGEAGYSDGRNVTIE